jgi:hypothetical protein
MQLDRLFNRSDCIDNRNLTTCAYQMAYGLFETLLWHYASPFLKMTRFRIFLTSTSVFLFTGLWEGVWGLLSVVPRLPWTWQSVVIPAVPRARSLSIIQWTNATSTASWGDELRGSRLKWLRTASCISCQNHSCTESGRMGAIEGNEYRHILKIQVALQFHKLIGRPVQRSFAYQKGSILEQTATMHRASWRCGFQTRTINLGIEVLRLMSLASKVSAIWITKFLRIPWSPSKDLWLTILQKWCWKGWYYFEEKDNQSHGACYFDGLPQRLI